MARGRRTQESESVAADERVVWIAPEALGASEERIGQAMADGATAAEIVEMSRPPAFGEYRMHEEDEITDGNLIVPVFSDDRYVWVDDAPGDDEDGSGHFEVFDPDTHGWGSDAEYRPILKANAVGDDDEARSARGISVEPAADDGEEG